MFWFAVEIENEHATTLERSIVDSIARRFCNEKPPVVPVVYVKQNDAHQQFVFNRAALDAGVLNMVARAQSCEAPQPTAYKRII